MLVSGNVARSYIQVRETSAGHADQKNGTEDGGERNTSTDGGEELQCQAV